MTPSIRQTLFVIIVLFSIGSVSGQAGFNILGQNQNANFTAVPFLLISPDTRANGMGSVGVASEPDANSTYWNPSKLVFLKDTLGFSVSYLPWLRTLVPDINFSYISFYHRLPNDQALGISLRYFSYDNIQFNNYNNVTKGIFNPNEFAFDLSYSRKLSYNWSAGLTVRYIYSDLTGASSVQGQYTNPGQSVAADISAYHKGNDSPFFNGDCNLSEGICISDMGPKISYSNSRVSNFLPTNLRAGAAFTINFNGFNKLSVMEDINKLLVPTPPVYGYSQTGQFVILSGMNPNVSVPQGILQSFYDAPGGALQEFHEITWSTGLEYTYNNKYSVRTGFFYEDPNEGGREYYSVGAGYRLLTLTIDAAYLIPVSQYNPLQNTLCISFSFDFSPKKKATHITA